MGSCNVHKPHSRSFYSFTLFHSIKPYTLPYFMHSMFLWPQQEEVVPYHNRGLIPDLMLFTSHILEQQEKQVCQCRDAGSSSGVSHRSPPWLCVCCMTGYDKNLQLAMSKLKSNVSSNVVCALDNRLYQQLEWMSWIILSFLLIEGF